MRREGLSGALWHETALLPQSVPLKRPAPTSPFFRPRYQENRGTEFRPAQADTGHDTPKNAVLPAFIPNTQKKKPSACQPGGNRRSYSRK